MELRIRVRKSATGSVKLIVSPSFPVRSAYPAPPAENQRECLLTFSLSAFGRTCFAAEGRLSLDAQSRPVLTSWTSLPQESRPSAPAHGNTAGTLQTCAGTPAAFRTAGSGYAAGS